MLTDYDVQALIDLLQRTPMSPAEQLFASTLIGKLSAAAARQAKRAQAKAERAAAHSAAPQE